MDKSKKSKIIKTTAINLKISRQAKSGNKNIFRNSIHVFI